MASYIHVLHLSQPRGIANFHMQTPILHPGQIGPFGGLSRVHEPLRQWSDNQSEGHTSYALLGLVCVLAKFVPRTALFWFIRVGSIAHSQSVAAVQSR